MRFYLPCVGLIVMFGTFGMIVVPEVPQPFEERPIFYSLPTVIIDAGHGGRDDGAKRNGLVEKDLNLEIAIMVEEMLRDFEFPTRMTRSDDSYVSLEERVNIANGIENALYISIHFNQASQSAVSGVEVFYTNEKSSVVYPWSWVGFFSPPPEQKFDNSGEILAGFIQASLVTSMEVPNRGIKKRGLYVTRNVQAPSVLIEGGFISNAWEAQLLKNRDYKERLATAIVKGVLVYQKTIHQDVRPLQLAKYENE